MSKIIINADDFGFTKAVSLGIVTGAKYGCITSTSLIVNLDDSAYAASLIDSNVNLGVGLHINVTKGKPVSSLNLVKTLVESNGEFHSSSWYLDKNNRVDENELILEFDNQFKRFTELMNRLPDHIDIHHIYDFYGNYPKLCQHIVNSYDIPCRMDNYPSYYKYPKVKKLDNFETKEYTFESYLNTIKNAVDEEYIELTMHPGFVDKKLMNMSSLNLDRMNDLDVIMNKDFIKEIEKMNLSLCKFSDLKKETI